MHETPYSKFIRIGILSILILVFPIGMPLLYFLANYGYEAQATLLLEVFYTIMIPLFQIFAILWIINAVTNAAKKPMPKGKKMEIQQRNLMGRFILLGMAGLILFAYIIYETLTSEELGRAPTTTTIVLMIILFILAAIFGPVAGKFVKKNGKIWKWFYPFS